MRGVHAVVVAGGMLLGTACGGDDDGFGSGYTGEAGHPIPAAFAGWIPGVDASLGGHGPSRFLLDSGAPITLVDIDDFSEFREGWHDVDLLLGDLDFPRIEVAASDIFTYDQGRPDPFTGIIGGNVLTGFALSLDYQGGRVWLEDGPADLPEGLAPEAVGDPIEFRAQVVGGGSYAAGGELRGVGPTRMMVWAAAEDQGEGDGFWLLVDSGATSVVLSNDLMEELGDPGRPRLDGISVGTVSGEQTAYVTRLWSLRVGEVGDGFAVEQASVPVLVLPDDFLFDSLSVEVGTEVGGVVGGQFLRWYVATLDFPAERLRLLPYTEPDHIDPDEFVGVGFELGPSQGDWVVRSVYPGTDADAKGMEVGETVAEIAGQPVAGLSIAEVYELLGAFDLGEEIPIGLDRDGKVVELGILVEELLPAFEAPR